MLHKYIKHPFFKESKFHSPKDSPFYDRDSKRGDGRRPSRYVKTLHRNVFTYRDGSERPPLLSSAPYFSRGSPKEKKMALNVFCAKSHKNAISRKIKYPIKEIIIRTISDKKRIVYSQINLRFASARLIIVG